MRWPVLCLFFLLMLHSLSCKKALQDASTGKGIGHENNFFTLDMEKGGVGKEAFSQHFFTNFPHKDPTVGDVVYDQAVWKHEDLLHFKDTDGLYAYIRYRDDSLGFDSHRLTSKSFFNLTGETDSILFVFKGSLPQAMGMWPAWWLNGSREKAWLYQDSMPVREDQGLVKYSGVGMPYDIQSAVNNTDWPAAGEIDIIENINAENEVHNTLHTCPQMCDSEWNGDGQVINCANARPGGDVNKGCSGRTYSVDKLEGTFACVWESGAISFYHWPAGAAVRAAGGPLSRNPKPALWTGNPLKNRVRLMETDVSCQDSIHQAWQCENCAGKDRCAFKNMKMIFNVTLCGIWAGSHFDDSDKAWENCREYILGAGREAIDNQYIKIEYVSATGL